MLKKQVNQHKTYKTISNQEAIVLNAIVQLTLFSTRDVLRIIQWSRKRIYNTVQSLKQKGTIPTKTVYERDMLRLTTRVLPYEQIKKEVLAFLKKQSL